MHRFRKRSETGRSVQVPNVSPVSDELDDTPQFPLPNDFRTSLILPDLSRRFSLLRFPSGEPVSFDALRSKLADQRARGVENQITEEEEEMILDTLRSLRPRPSQPSKSPGVAESDDVRGFRGNTQSSASSSSVSTNSSPGRGSSKRYSNNLFGSGRFNDYSYMRSVTKNGGSRAQSFTTKELSNSREGTPVAESTTAESSNGSTQSTDDGSLVRSPPSTSPPPYGDEPIVSVAEYRISKTLGPSALKRASVALEQVIKEFEEETEDQILMPRSTPIPRPNLATPPVVDAERKSSASQSSIFEAVVAISSDKVVHSDPEIVDKRASPIPSRILPGYVPGMPRPMTPREFDLDEQRSHSTTPRATSPMVANLADASMVSFNTAGRLRSNSSGSQSGSRSPTSPLFLQRSPSGGGRFSLEDSNRANYTEFDSPLNSSLLARRRPASPLANPPFTPLTVSSRPSTPSNIIWNTNTLVSQRPEGHSRDNSWVSDAGSDVHGTLERYEPGPRNLRSPPLPDSPIEGTNLILNPVGPSLSQHVSTATTSTEPSSPRQPRSITPTQTRSPTSPAFDGSINTNTQVSSDQNFLPNPPIILQPLANSSRSSLRSDGSSYHSSSAREKDESLILFKDLDDYPPLWHDLTSGPFAPGGFRDNEVKPEELVARLTGLRKSDFKTIQDKLVAALDAKAKEENNQQPQERAASSLRKRRPSTSQSNYSYSPRELQVASPPPQPQTSSSKLVSPSSTKVDRPLSALGNNISPPLSSRDKDTSLSTRRNRDLAQALFGNEGAESSTALLSKPTSAEPIPLTQSLSTQTPDLNAHSSSSTLSPTTAYQPTRNPSVPWPPQTPREEAKLVQAVQEQNKAAMERLKSSNHGHSPDPHATTPRKRISPNQISSPTLVSASTSVVNMPPVKLPTIMSSNATGASKIGSRFKKLRGTLRAKSFVPSGDEITPYNLDSPSSPTVQTAHYDPARSKESDSVIATSATEARFKVSVPSPPASAGPGLKGFMARFRSKQRPTTAPLSGIELKQSPHTQVLPSPVLPPPSAPIGLSFKTAQSATVGRKPVPVSRPQTLQVQSAPPTQVTHQVAVSDEPEDASDTAALRQLFEAANRIGIDQGELNALLARSGSTSSKADWSALTRSKSAIRSDATPADSFYGRASIDDQGVRPDTKVSDRVTSHGRQSLDGQAPRDKSISRQTSRKQPDHLRRPRENKNDTNAVVRKTIIVPDTNMTVDELKVFMEKSLPGRRVSVTSVSNRSVHERAPTPPPPRSPTHKHFSGLSPPMPSLPVGVGNALISTPASAGGPIEKSNSTHDSFYDMYGETRSPSTVPNDSGPSRTEDDSALPSDSGAAVELTHLANGETIWNIVNGLREQDDDQSVYSRRTSFASEYTPRANGDGLQVFVKEHGRSGSKGSTSSFPSRQRTQGKTWPETKVFYTPTEGIGRLIQDISQNMEAGSFNFAPRPGHSVSSSMSTADMTWSLEERLDEMIDTVRVK